ICAVPGHAIVPRALEPVGAPRRGRSAARSGRPGTMEDGERGHAGGAAGRALEGRIVRRSARRACASSVVIEPSSFPFSAMVGLDTLKLALELSAIDPRLSVLIRGDKGAGKSTAARGLAELLPRGSPFVTLPIGATEDRLLGGLDIERTLKGEPV